jgi:hypothetical protein
MSQYVATVDKRFFTGFPADHGSYTQSETQQGATLDGTAVHHRWRAANGPLAR